MPVSDIVFRGKVVVRKGVGASPEPSGSGARPRACCWRPAPTSRREAGPVGRGVGTEQFFWQGLADLSGEDCQHRFWDPILVGIGEFTHFRTYSSAWIGGCSLGG